MGAIIIDTIKKMRSRNKMKSQIYHKTICFSNIRFNRIKSKNWMQIKNTQWLTWWAFRDKSKSLLRNISNLIIYKTRTTIIKSSWIAYLKNRILWILNFNSKFSQIKIHIIINFKVNTKIKVICNTSKYSNTILT